VLHLSCNFTLQQWISTKNLKFVTLIRAEQLTQVIGSSSTKQSQSYGVTSSFIVVDLDVCRTNLQLQDFHTMVVIYFSCNWLDLKHPFQRKLLYIQIGSPDGST
jgi:hypothetical protein